MVRSWARAELYATVAQITSDLMVATSSQPSRMRGITFIRLGHLTTEPPDLGV